MINIEVTPEIKQRIVDALIETKELLENQLRLEEKDQDKEAITEYEEHILKLETALQTGIYNSIITN